MKSLIAVMLAASLGAPAWAAQPSFTAQQPTAENAALITPVTFVEKATSSGQFEIQSSKIALDKAQSDDVRAFAQRMIDDHTAAAKKLADAAKAEGVLVPEPFLTAEEQAEIDKLSAADGNTFDTLYADMQVKAHEAAVQLFQTYATKGGELGSFAQNTLPTLKDHYQAAQDLQG